MRAQRFEYAQRALESLVKAVPGDTGALLDLADVLFARGQVQASTKPLLQASAALPKDAPLVLALVQRLIARGEVLAARRCLDFLSCAPAPPPELLAAQAHLRFAIGEIAIARELMARAIAAGVDSPGELHLYAMLLQFDGQVEKARVLLERCLARWPNFGDAAVVLANTCRLKPDSALLKHAREQLARLSSGPQTRDSKFVRAEFEYTVFKALDDIGSHDEAWLALSRCNALMHELNPYDAHGQAAVVDALKSLPLPQGKTTSPARTRGEAPIPIFIVGMPRSGTTLLDRILSSHSQIASAGEIIDFWRQLHWAADVRPAKTQGFLAAIRRSPEIDFHRLGQRYLAQTRWRAQGRKYYIDKLPANVQMVPFIRQALPNAIILHMLRDPLDTCFSNFKAMFGNVSPYSYDLASLAHFYRQYVRLVDHWRVRMPGVMLDVNYASLVQDTERSVRRILAYCDLEIEAGCLRPELNSAPVATPSSHQVRESIHARGIDQWRRYAHQLEPLARLLSLPPVA